MTVLIVTHSQDNDAVDRVAAAVEARGVRARRFDTDRFPTETTISILDEPGVGDSRPRGWIVGPQGELALEEISAVYYRRSQVGGRIPADLDPQLRAPSIEESRRVVHGLMAMLQAGGVFVLDRLEVVRRAQLKSLQLALARRVGLEVPRTLVSNDPTAVRAFAARNPEGIITKMMASFAVLDEGGASRWCSPTP